MSKTKTTLDAEVFHSQRDADEIRWNLRAAEVEAKSREDKQMTQPNPKISDDISGLLKEIDKMLGNAATASRDADATDQEWEAALAPIMDLVMNAHHRLDEATDTFQEKAREDREKAEEKAAEEAKAAMLPEKPRNLPPNHEDMVLVELTEGSFSGKQYALVGEVEVPRSLLSAYHPVIDTGGERWVVISVAYLIEKGNYEATVVSEKTYLCRLSFGW